MAGVKRADRIAPRDAVLPLRPDVLSGEADRVLLEAYEAAAGRVKALRPDDVEGLVDATLPLADPIDRFFTDVLVMAEDEAVRTNRLRLVRSVQQLFAPIADFARVQTK